MFILDDVPRNGWVINGVLIHRPFTYLTILDWFNSTTSLLPAKAARMQKYSDSKLWTKGMHQHYWIPVLITWLNKQERKE